LGLEFSLTWEESEVELSEVNEDEEEDLWRCFLCLRRKLERLDLLRWRVGDEELDDVVESPRSPDEEEESLEVVDFERL
jgi:hypothetical protein